MPRALLRALLAILILSIAVSVCNSTIMADKRQSARTQRRRRLEIARLMVEAKRSRLESDSSLTVETGDSMSDSESEETETTDFCGSEWEDGGDPGPSGPETYGGFYADGEEREETAGLEADSSDEGSIGDGVGSTSSAESTDFDGAWSEGEVGPVSSTSDASFSSVCGDGGVDDVEVSCSDFVPLFGDSQLNARHFGVLFLSLAQRHNLTVASQNDILKFLHLTLPNPNRVPSSCYTVRTQFLTYNKETVVQHYCGNCLDVLALGSTCAKEGCIHAMESKAVFVQLQLHSQLKERFDDPEFANLLQYRFQRQMSSEILGDIYDGSEYKKYSDFFAQKYNVSFALNYDGAPKFKPVQLYLNELPPQIRASREYLFLAGIWCSSKKPPTETFLSPLVEQLKLLATEGVKVSVNQEEVICKAKLLFTLADLPAKSALANCNQYNGEFGCLSCKHPGEQVRRGRGYARVYGYQAVSMRSHEEHLQHATEAEATRKTTFGVKGMSIMHSLPNFDIINNNPVDYMHCVLLGVVKQRLLPLWFDSVYHRNPWYIGTKVKEVDMRLSEVKPPDTVTRVPRSVKTKRQWKATECRTFLLYYLPILMGILPDKYLSHALLLSKAMQILLGDCITTQGVETAEQLLILFIKLHQKYYGLEHCTVNVHLLSHLPHYVRLFGPCWTHSAFPFEDGIGYLVKRSHATHDIANQIVTSFLLQWKLHVAKKKLDLPIEFQAFMRGLKSTPSARLSPKRLTYNASAVGISRHHELEAEEAAAVQKLGMVPADCSAVMHPKIILRNQLIFSRKATRVKKRNSYTVKYRDMHESDELHYGRVEKFVTICTPLRLSEVSTSHVAIIRPLYVRPGLSGINCPEETLQLMPLLFDTIITILGEKSQLVAITLDKIVCKCFDVSTGAISYLLPIINEKEREL